MTPTASATRVVAISDNRPTQQQIVDALGAQSDMQLVSVLHDLEKSGRELRAAEADLILIDHTVNGQPTLDIIDDLALQFPEAAIIALLPDNDPVRAQQVTLAGARAFLVQPFTQVSLLSILRRVRDLEARRVRPTGGAQAKSEESAAGLKTLAVFSPRGGAGTSTVAANLAVALRLETGKRVLLLEGKLFFGHLDVLLNLRSHNTLADLIPHASALDEGLVREVALDHVSGIEVLLGPGDVQVAQGIRAQDLYAVVSSLQRMYDYVIIDAGSSLSENTVTLLDLADKILVVTNPELAALHDAGRFIQISRSLAYPPGKVLLLLNRSGQEGGIKTREVQAALHQELFASIPDDSQDALRSLNRGIPLLLRYPRSPASQSFKGLAQWVASQSAAKQAPKEAVKTGGKERTRPMLKRSAG